MFNKICKLKTLQLKIVNIKKNPNLIDFSCCINTTCKGYFYYI